MSKASKAADGEEEAWGVATLEAIATLRDAMQRAGYQDRIAAAKQVLDRTRPVPKASSVQIAVSAGDRGQAIALSKVQQRLIQERTDATDAAFTSLGQEEAK